MRRISAILLLALALMCQVFCSDSELESPDNVRTARQVFHTTLPPYLIQIGYEDRTYPGVPAWQCAGSLIAELKAITSNSCVNTINGAPQWVRYGQVIARVVRYLVRDSVALLFLEQPINIGQNFACISNDFNINNALAAGWGGVTPYGEARLRMFNDLPSVVVTKVKFESYRYVVKPVAATSCVADLGGPLQIPGRRPGCVFEVVGVLSQWPNCGQEDSYGLYTPVANYSTWIQQCTIYTC